MKVAAISDTHGYKDSVIPPCDVLIHAGDITGHGTLHETREFARRLAANGDLYRLVNPALVLDI